MKKTLTIRRAVSFATLTTILCVSLYYLVFGVDYFGRSNRTYLCYDKGWYRTALLFANHHVNKDGADHWDACYLRAMVHARLGDLEKAEADLTMAVEFPHERLVTFTEVRPLVARGRCYEQLGMREAAAADYIAAYKQMVNDIAQQNEAEPEHQVNCMRIVQEFWSHREIVDREFEFDHLEFQSSDSYREAQRLRLNAVLDWLREFVDVHPTIIANIDDVDAKVYRLHDNDDERGTGE